MTKTSLLREKKNELKGDYGLRNVYFREIWRGLLFYQKRCYHCREFFLANRQDVLCCSTPSCQQAVSRRIAKGQPLRPFHDAPKEPGRGIDFVKWGMESAEIARNENLNFEIKNALEKLSGLRTAKLNGEDAIQQFADHLNEALQPLGLRVYCESEK